MVSRASAVAEHPRRPPLALALALGLLLHAAAARAEVVVSEPGAEGASLGIAAGDRLRAWRVPDSPHAAWRPIASWAEPWRLDFFEIPRRGGIEIEVARDGESRVIRSAARPLELEVEPVLPSGLAAEIESLLAGDPPYGATLETLRRRTSGAGGEATAWALARLGRRAAARADLDTALAAHLAAAEAAPVPFAGELLRRAGDVALRLGRFDEAESIYRRALEVWRADDPEGIGVSVLLSSMGSLRGRQQRLEESFRFHSRACELRRRSAPESWLVSNCLNNLGITAGRRNDLAEAESSFVEALELDRRLGRDSAPMLANLGIVARLRGDLDRAEHYTLEAIETYGRRGDLQQVLAKRITLANIVADRGDDGRALEIYDRLIAVDLPRSPDASSEISSRLNRARIHQRQGRPDAAGIDLDRAEELLGAAVRTTGDGADIRQLRAEIAFGRAELAAATALCSEALEDQARLRPDSLHEARAASLCARIAAARRDWTAADELFARSIRAIELQQRRIGGGERGLVAFRQRYRPLYQEFVDYLQSRGRTVSAFELLERYRAQALRALLLQRDLELPSRAPAELGAERDRLGAEIETAYGKLARLAPAAPERAALRAEIDALHRRREEIAVRIRDAVPELGRAEAPGALGVGELAAALPAGTLALVYDLSEESGRLFVLDPQGGVEAHPIAAGSDALAADVARWLEETGRPRPGVALRQVAERLSATLLGPVAARLAVARRLLVIPDGPLHALSFAALPLPGGAAGAGSYLIERLPIARDVSVSIFAIAARRGGGADRSLAGPDARRVAVFGDPTPSSQATSRFRAELGRLPATRAEAADIGALFGARAEVFLGDEATESAARRVLPGAGVAHFACHAVIDEQLPLDSALVLSPDSTSGGLLQAWEIAEEIRLDGALVVLSACDTARGGERAGEGIVGLVRALQVAGAEAVVASLWRIADESSAELMKRFYRHLGAGLARDEALRQAQLELLRAPIEIVRDGRPARLDASAPRHWAPFVLLGSPR